MRLGRFVVVEVEIEFSVEGESLSMLVSALGSEERLRSLGSVGFVLLVRLGRFVVVEVEIELSVDGESLSMLVSALGSEERFRSLGSVGFVLLVLRGLFVVVLTLSSFLIPVSLAAPVGRVLRVRRGLFVVVVVLVVYGRVTKSSDDGNSLL